MALPLLGRAATSRRLGCAAPSCSAVVEALRSLHMSAICGGCCVPFGNECAFEDHGLVRLQQLNGVEWDAPG